MINNILPVIDRSLTSLFGEIEIIFYQTDELTASQSKIKTRVEFRLFYATIKFYLLFAFETNNKMLLNNKVKNNVKV